MTFESTVLPHRDALYRLANQLTRNHADAQDLVQETMVRAFTRFELLRAEGATLTWLRCILRRLFLNRCEKVKAERRDVSLTAWEEVGVLPVALSAESQPERTTLSRAEADAVHRAITALPASYRPYILLGVVEELPYQEIADRLNVPLTTVRTRIHRGRKMVQDALYIG